MNSHIFSVGDDVKITKGEFEGRGGRVVDVEVNEENNTVYVVAVLLGNFTDLCYLGKDLVLDM